MTAASCFVEELVKSVWVWRLEREEYLDLRRREELKRVIKVVSRVEEELEAKKEVKGVVLCKLGREISI